MREFFMNRPLLDFKKQIWYNEGKEALIVKLLIVRHGDPDYELDSLTETGKREAKLLAERLKDEKIDYVYSSPLGRAKLTCEIAAKSMGKEKEIGSLEVGKKADIIIIDCHQPHLAPWGVMPVQRIVNHATGADVSHTIVDGKVVMENRKLTMADENKIISDAEKAFDLMCKRSGVLDYAVENNKLWQVK